MFTIYWRDYGFGEIEWVTTDQSEWFVTMLYDRNTLKLSESVRLWI